MRRGRAARRGPLRRRGHEHARPPRRGRRAASTSRSWARLGLGSIIPLVGVPPAEDPVVHGRLHPLGPGKDTTAGPLGADGGRRARAAAHLSRGFPPEIVERLSAALGPRGHLQPALQRDRGDRRLRGRAPAHGRPDRLHLAGLRAPDRRARGRAEPEELYAACAAAREIMRGEHEIGRVIARPFRGEPGRLPAHRGPARLRAARRPRRSYLEAVEAAGRRGPRRGQGGAGLLAGRRDAGSTRPPPTPRRIAATTELLAATSTRGSCSRTSSRPTRSTGTARTSRASTRALREIDAAVGRVAGAAAPGRHARADRRPRLRPDDAGHRPHARARAAARRLRGPRRASPRRRRSPTSARRCCAGSPARTRRCREHPSCREVGACVARSRAGGPGRCRGSGKQKRKRKRRGSGRDGGAGAAQRRGCARCAAGDPWAGADRAQRRGARADHGARADARGRPAPRGAAGRAAPHVGALRPDRPDLRPAHRADHRARDLPGPRRSRQPLLRAAHLPRGEGPQRLAPDRRAPREPSSSPGSSRACARCAAATS